MNAAQDDMSNLNDMLGVEIVGHTNNVRANDAEVTANDGRSSNDLIGSNVTYGITA